MRLTKVSDAGTFSWACAVTGIKHKRKIRKKSGRTNIKNNGLISKQMTEKRRQTKDHALKIKQNSISTKAKTSSHALVNHHF
jgi:hypothetical protein